MSETDANIELLTRQYDVYVRDLGSIGSRHTQTNALYATLITALIVFISLAAEKHLSNEYGTAAAIAVGLTGIILCVIWWFHVRSYGALYKAKFDVLREMEQHLPFACYQRETQLLGIDASAQPAAPGNRYRLLNVLERYVILALSIPFIVLLVRTLWVL